jgi:hypothetical protein
MLNPSLAPLAVLVGDWRVELTNAEFLEPGTSMSGTLSVSWLHEAFLVLRSTTDADGPPTSVSVIGRNEDRDDYELLYADDRGVSRIYRMTFADGVWIQHREDPGFHQRFQGTVDPGGDRISASWTKSHDDGATWQHDFDLTYTRR